MNTKEFVPLYPGDTPEAAEREELAKDIFTGVLASIALVGGLGITATIFQAYTQLQTLSPDICNQVISLAGYCSR